MAVSQAKHFNSQRNGRRSRFGRSAEGEGVPRSESFSGESDISERKIRVWRDRQVTRISSGLHPLNPLWHKRIANELCVTDCGWPVNLEYGMRQQSTETVARRVRLRELALALAFAIGLHGIFGLSLFVVVVGPRLSPFCPRSFPEPVGDSSKTTFCGPEAPFCWRHLHGRPCSKCSEERIRTVMIPSGSQLPVPVRELPRLKSVSEGPWSNEIEPRVFSHVTSDLEFGSSFRVATE